MIAYCGIDCSKCESFIATRSGNDDKLKKVARKLSKRYRADVQPDYVICDGCRDGERHSFYCENSCKMRKCCITKEYNSCIECKDFPCKELQFELEHHPEAIDNLKQLKRLPLPSAERKDRAPAEGSMLELPPN